MALVLGSCVPSVSETVVGVGPAVSEELATEAFDRVSVRGELDLDVRVGQARGVVVTAEENLLGYIRHEVKQGRLELFFERGYQLEPTPRITVTCPELNAVALAGSGAVTVRGWSGGSAELSVTGSGRLEGRGTLDAVEVELTGSGDVDLIELETGVVGAELTGSGSLSTHVGERLVARITGSGDVRYRGEPEVEADVVGSGRVLPFEGR